MRMETIPPQTDNWSSHERDFSVKNNRHYESIFALGTGYMTVRSSIEEGFSDDDQSYDYMRMPVNVTLEKLRETKNRYGTFLPVVQSKHPLLRTGLTNLPWFLGLVVSVDGEKLDMEHGAITDYHRWLDIKEATLYRAVVWETKSGKEVNALFKRFMNPELRFTCVQECKITLRRGNADVTIESAVDTNVRTNGLDVFTDHAVDADGAIMLSDVTTNIGGRVVTASLASVSKTDQFHINREARKISAVYSFTLQEGEEAVIQKVSAVASDMYFPENGLRDAAKNMLKNSAGQTTDALHRAHAAVWADYWDLADITIEAEEADGYNSQLAARLAVYHLMRAKAKEEDRSLVCPKGMTSEVYFGSVFWDMDIFIQPFFIYTNPAIAKTTPMYRYRTLDAARKRTAEAGYRGARYPWMGDVNGDETCPLFEYADHQVHVTSDVIIGMWHYVRETQDTDFLYNQGLEMLLETSRYWVERVDTLKGKPGYHLLGVMGPDEYTHFCTDNAYTNHSVKFCLNLAVEIAEKARREAPEAYQAVTEKISFNPRELATFRDVADGLSIPVDKDRNIIWQCDGYDTQYADIDIEGIWKDKTKPFGDYVHQEKRYRSKVMKQSDVGALLCLFSEDFTLERKKASMAYYAPYNTNESSNSMCHNMILAANIGDKKRAYDSWKASMDIDFGKRPRSVDGIHCANIGGMWQQIVHGFAGMVSVLNTDTLTFHPCVPDEISNITFKLYWKRDLARITVTTSTVEVENLSTNPIPFIVNDDTAVAAPGNRAVLTY
ncbi:MAG: glycosyl hydrolase family 65 protein [Lentisphaeria bacterium]|nr:glycosyl hydrolase family 65 protein [Lentisphaeria bacterium]